MNCWSVPLKDSEYLILYELFYGIAKFIDRYIPGEKSSKEPRINLRYFCNPLVFMLSVIVIILIFKIMFWLQIFDVLRLYFIVLKVSILIFIKSGLIFPIKSRTFISVKY